jgi:DNA-binding NarL/FixJ family response regulator
MPLEILIADDSSAVRKAVRNYLTERHFNVCGEAIDGEDAIEKTRKLKPDLILLDLAMPRANGIVVASVVKDMAPNTRIVLFTMYSEALRRTFHSVNLVDAIVGKSEGMGKLAECLQRLLAAPESPHN